MQEKLRELMELKCQLSSQLETIAQGNEALRAEQDAVKSVSLALVRCCRYLLVGNASASPRSRCSPPPALAVHLSSSKEVNTALEEAQERQRVKFEAELQHQVCVPSRSAHGVRLATQWTSALREKER